MKERLHLCNYYLIKITYRFVCVNLFNCGNVRCDGCKMIPIGGPRFKCKECDDFDHCDDCFKTKTNHKHDFIKISEPEQSPTMVGKPRMYLERCTHIYN